MNSIQVHEQYAANYDQMAHDYGYVLPDVLFGLCYEFLKPGQRLLDIGIGTGLSAVPFYSAGLEIYGLDGSLEMLNICRAKNIAVELKQFDLHVRPWPYPDNYFDHSIACGVIHFIPDLDTIFDQVARLVRLEGTFAFTTKSPLLDALAGMNQRAYTTEKIDGVDIFSHSPSYIEMKLTAHGFEVQKKFKFLLPRGLENQDDLYTAYVAQKLDS